MIMLANYFKVLIRNMWKNKFSSLLNMLGLAIGMTCYLLIVQYVNFELSYDGFHQNASDIYRLQLDSYEDNGDVIRYAINSFSVGPTMKDEFPEIKEVSRCLRFENNTVERNDQVFNDERIYITEPSFFKIFTIRLLQGDPETALQGARKVLLSRSYARKYFDHEDPIGQMLQIATRRGEIPYIVTGVFEDLPENSHMKFDLLISLSTFFPATYSDFIHSTVYTHFLLTPGADAKALEAKMPAFIKKYILKDVPRAANWVYHLQPLRDIYLYSDLTFDTENGNGKMVYFLLIIAFIILVISWVNYVNLSTARAMERAREVGTRKVLGSHRLQLSKQFLGESILANIIPIAISVILAIIFLPFLRELTGKNIPLYLTNAWFLAHIVILYLIGSLIAGLYPAVLLSSFPPVTVISKSKFSQTAAGRLLKKILVIFQFAASVVLIILTLTVYKQIRYMTSSDLGMNIDHMVGIVFPSAPLSKESTEKLDSLKTELLRYPAIDRVTASFTIPGVPTLYQLLVWKENTDFKNGKILSITPIDEDFLPAYQIKLLTGRNFSKEYGTDKQAVILNESAVKSLGYDNPETAVNQNVSIWTKEGSFKIIGIIKNFHQQSLKKNPEPLVFLLNPALKNFYSIKLNPAYTNINETLTLIEKKWKEIFPAHPFDYYFLDDFFNRQYKDDYHFGNVLGIFVLLAVIITCLGLLGLSHFSSYQRRKEIALRKSIGASIGSILGLLVKDILKLVVIAVLIAWPVTYLIVDHWLKNYAYRIAVPLLFFVLSGLILVIITLATIAYHTFTAARSNPVDALKEE
jgi:putative ABC transport system permease protein